ARKPAGAPFSYGGLLTELGLLGNIACTQKGKALHYDGKAGRFVNNEEANTLLRRTYREGFELRT
ncbi:MAG TPA: gfo/Idh/MocA family oxidoreductase, partial [Acidobacteriota bacterium]|nr:gfo/Idh/MocA family oxidoreductase [Acidobacteriota bacterium]